jgi:hypothetical protein
VLHAVITLAADAADSEPSKTAFYIAGGLLAGWGFFIGIVGTLRHGDFPSAGASRALMGISALLVVAAMASAVASG